MLSAAVRDTGTDAGTNVAAQSVRTQSTRLPEDDVISEVAEDGSSAG